jgi:hypothetical protein
MLAKPVKALAVIAHRPAAAFIKEAAKEWRETLNHFEKISFISPEGPDRLEWREIYSGLVPAACFYYAGESEREGPGCIARMQLAARTLAHRASNPFIPRLCALLEYDVYLNPVALHPKLLEAKPGVLYVGRKFGCEPDNPRGFRGKAFGHAPWFAYDHVWEMLGKFNPPDKWIEHGTPDRWLGWACEELGVAIECLGGYAQNTVLPEHVDEMKRALKAGAPCVHGIKDVPTLMAAREAVRL